MGRLLYGAPPSAHPFDDRVLAHLQVVITSRFRRGEGFLLTIDADEFGGHRTELWLHPTIPARYEYDAAERPELNPNWLRDLSAASNGRLGLHLVPEPVSSADERTGRVVA